MVAAVKAARRAKLEEIAQLARIGLAEKGKKNLEVVVINDKVIIRPKVRYAQV
jgi:hypothetical protein